MAIIARYQRHLSPPTSPFPSRPPQAPNLTVRAPFPRTDSEDRREELAKQLARDEEPVSMSSPGGEDASHLLAKAVVGRYTESFLPGIREHRTVLKRGVEVVEENLRQCSNGGGRRRKGDTASALSSFVREIEVELLVWTRIAPPVAVLYAWWVAFAIWRKLDGGEQDFLARFTANREKVETWLTWAFAGLAVLLCVLAFVVWAVVEVIRLFPGPKLEPPLRKGNEYM